MVRGNLEATSWIACINPAAGQRMMSRSVIAAARGIEYSAVRRSLAWVLLYWIKPFFSA
jgi:hypothetical protein